MKKYGLFLPIIIMMLLALGCSVVYAADIFYYVEEQYTIQGGTDSFYIGSDDTYAVNVTTGKSFTIGRDDKNDGVPAPSHYDLLLYADTGVVIDSVDISGNTKKEIYGTNGGEKQKVYLYENVEYATNTTVTVTYTGGNVKAIVLTHFDNNVFVKSFFELRMLRDEAFHDLGNKNKMSDADWKKALSGIYSTTTEDKTTTTALTVEKEYDKYYYVDYDEKEDEKGAVTVPNNLIQGNFNPETDTSIVFTNFRINCKNVLLGGGGNVSFTKGNDDYFYSETYGLRIKFDSGSAFTMEFLPYTPIDEVKNVYFINDIVITQDCVINFPAYINLLYANINVKASDADATKTNLSVSHHYAGVFAIETLGGKITANSALNFEINTPNAYVENTDVFDTDEAHKITVEKNSELINFLAEGNEEALNALLDDAMAFALAKVPSYIYGDIILATSFHNYPISIEYKYSADDNSGEINFIKNFSNPSDAENIIISEYGNVIRPSDTVSGIVSAVVTFTPNATSKTASKNFSVVGTSDKAIAETFKERLNEKINPSGDSLFKPIEFYNLFIDCLTDAKNVKIELALKNSDKDADADFVSFWLEYGTTRIETKKIIAYANNTGELYFDIGDISVSTDDIDGLCIKADFITIEKCYLNVSYGNSDAETLTICGDVPLNVVKASTADRRDYLARYFTTKFFSNDADEEIYLPYLSSDNLFKIKLPAVIGYTETVLVGSGFGIKGINYKFYKTTTNEYDNYILNQNIAVLIGNSTCIDNAFVYEEGIVKLKKGGTVYLESNEMLFYIAEIEFDESSTTNTEQIARRLLIPSSGLGGSELNTYIAGNTFSEYFRNNPVLINSSDVFKTGNSTVHLIMDIENKDEVFDKLDNRKVGDYCTAKLEKNDEWIINIDIDKIPKVNSIITVKFVFYTGTDIATSMQDVEENYADLIISTQHYSFKIPGIYRKGADVADGDVYEQMLKTYGWITSDGEHKLPGEAGLLSEGYLLVDDAEKSMAEFNLSSLAGKTLDIKGVNLLTGTKSMIFDGVTLSGLSCFADYKGNVLTNLSMKNCGITQDMLNSRALYELTSLTTLSLQSNSISSLTDDSGNPCIYRMVTDLNLNEQKDTLVDISSVASLPLLQTLRIENNKIRSFKPLRKLSYLKIVYLAGNVADEFANKKTNGHKGDTSDSIGTLTYFGTHGQINVPVYVALIDKGVTVYIAKLTRDNGIVHDIAIERLAKDGTQSYNVTASSVFKLNSVIIDGTPYSGTIDGGYQISNEQYHASLILNAIFLFEIQQNGISMPAYVDYMETQASSKKYSINTNFMIRDNVAIAFNESKSGNINNVTATGTGKIQTGIIASVTYEKVTVYALFEVIYEY